MDADERAGKIVADWLDGLAERTHRALSRGALADLRARIAASMGPDVETALDEIRGQLAALRENLPRVETVVVGPLRGEPAPAYVPPEPQAGEPPRGPMLAHESDEVAWPGRTPESAALAVVERWAHGLDKSVMAYVGRSALEDLRDQVESSIKAFVTRPPSPQPVHIEVGPATITGIWREESQAMLDLVAGRTRRTVAIDLPSCEPKAGEAWPEGVEAEHLAVALPALRDAMAAWSVTWTGREP